jgi:hypothetical protein
MESRTIQPHSEPTAYPEIPPRRCFQRAHTSIGAGSAGHWIKMAGILSPLIIGEIVKDNEKRWRWIRIASVATALISEGFHTQRIMQQRKERDEERREWRR